MEKILLQLLLIKQFLVLTFVDLARFLEYLEQQMSELILYDNDNLIDISLNEKIIDNMIKFDKNNEDNKYSLNIAINNIKTFQKSIIIKDGTEITKDIINNVMGLNNKIEIYIKYVENNISNIDTKLNDKTKNLINNISILQNEIFNKLKNSDLLVLNFNNIINSLNYEDKFNKYISEYSEYYNSIYNKNEVKEENNEIDRSFNTNMNNSKITKRDAEKTSLTATILLLIYILSYIWIASIK